VVGRRDVLRHVSAALIFSSPFFGQFLLRQAIEGSARTFPAHQWQRPIPARTQSSYCLPHDCGDDYATTSPSANSNSTV
jgi:hypothetical protein